MSSGGPSGRPRDSPRPSGRRPGAPPGQRGRARGGGRAGAAGGPGEGLAGLTDRELPAIAGSLPLESRRAAGAREVLVGRYGHLVRSCARRYSGSPEPAEDLMQVGYAGLKKDCDGPRAQR
jgi:hypothetical protein